MAHRPRQSPPSTDLGPRAALAAALVATLLGAAACAGMKETKGAARAASEDSGSDLSAMTGICPMELPGTRVAPAESEKGASLTFVTDDAASVPELRRRVHHLALLHNFEQSHAKRGVNLCPCPSSSPEGAGGSGAFQEQENEGKNGGYFDWWNGSRDPWFGMPGERVMGTGRGIGGTGSAPSTAPEVAPALPDGASDRLYHGIEPGTALPHKMADSRATWHPVTGGARIDFAPAKSADRASLKAALEQRAALLQAGGCPTLLTPRKAGAREGAERPDETGKGGSGQMPSDSPAEESPE